MTLPTAAIRHSKAMKRRNYNPVRRWGCIGIMAVYWLAFGLLILSLCGCSTTKYIPVESVRTEYRDRDVVRTVTDSVRDTRYVFVKGDTVLDIRDRWRERVVHDTVAVAVEVHDPCLCLTPWKRN